MNNNKMILTGIGDECVDIHIINIESNEYIHGKTVIGDIDTVIKHIQYAKEFYKTENIIIDFKTVGNNLIEKMKEGNII